METVQVAGGGMVLSMALGDGFRSVREVLKRPNTKSIQHNTARHNTPGLAMTPCHASPGQSDKS